MGLFSRKFDASTFEQELDGLEDQLSQTQARLLRLDVTGRRIKSKLIIWGSAVWVALFLYSWFSQRLHQHDLWILSHLVAIPAILIALVLINGRFFNWLKSRQRAHRIQLQKRKKAKIDELKKATNFNSTSEILSKFEGGGAGKINQSSSSSSSEPNGITKRAPVAGSHQGINSGQFNGLGGPGPQGVSNAPKGGMGGQIMPISGSSGSSGPPMPSNVDPNKRTVGDRILDFIVGGDNGLLEDRYALICSNCYAHNGLAPPGVKDPLMVKYSCPKCGHVNGKASLGETEVARAVKAQEMAELTAKMEAEKEEKEEEEKEEKKEMKTKDVTEMEEIGRRQEAIDIRRIT